jgi:hypothetical protein
MTSSSKKEPESIDVLCKRLETATSRLQGGKRQILLDVWEKLYGEYVTVVERVYNPEHIVSRLHDPNMCQAYQELVEKHHGKVMIVGHDRYGGVGAHYVGSLEEAEDVISKGKIFNGPVVWYQFNAVAYADEQTGHTRYRDQGAGRIVLRPYLINPPLSQPSLRAVHETPTSAS